MKTDKLHAWIEMCPFGGAVFKDWLKKFPIEEARELLLKELAMDEDAQKGVH